MKAYAITSSQARSAPGANGAFGRVRNCPVQSTHRHIKRFTVPIVAIASLLFVVTSVFAVPPQTVVNEFDFIEKLYDYGDFKINTHILFAG